MKLATLVYVRRDDSTLMLHRIRKANDMHAGKWNGLGGKLEGGESPEACAVREVQEESGLTIRSPVLRGMLTFPGFANDEDWYAFVFLAKEFSGTLIDSNEGVLEWIPDEHLLSLPLWEGDRIFLPWLLEPGFFSACFVYRDGRLREWDGSRYLSDGSVVDLKRLHAAMWPPQIEPPTTPDLASPGFDDKICWVCGGRTEVRTCKIVCTQCHFTRDCSDP